MRGSTSCRRSSNRRKPPTLKSASPDFPPSEGEEKPQVESGAGGANAAKSTPSLSCCADCCAVLRDQRVDRLDDGDDPRRSSRGSENRRSRLRKKKRAPLKKRRCSRAAPTRWKTSKACASLSFSADEESLASGFGFLSRKPLLVIFNEPEEQAGKSLDPAYQQELNRRGLQGLALAGKVEMEIAQLDENDRGGFSKEIGIDEPARERLSAPLTPCSI